MVLGFSKRFPLSLPDLSRMLLASLEHPEASQNDLISIVGLGSAKVTGFHRWMNMMGLRDSKSGKITDWGKLIARWDHYLQLPGTQWLLHARLCSNPDAEVWFHIANGLLPHHSELSITEAEDYLLSLGVGMNNRATLRRDISLFFRSYVDTDAFSGLHFLRLLPSGSYTRGDKVEIDPLVIASVIYYRRESGLATSTICVSNLLTEDSNVGKLFLLSGKELRQSLRQLEFKGLIRISRVADLDNIAYTFEGSSLDILRMYYEEERR